MDIILQAEKLPTWQEQHVASLWKLPSAWKLPNNRKDMRKVNTLLGRGETKSRKSHNN